MEFACHARFFGEPMLVARDSVAVSGWLVPAYRLSPSELLEDEG